MKIEMDIANYVDGFALINWPEDKVNRPAIHLDMSYGKLDATVEVCEDGDMDSLGSYGTEILIRRGGVAVWMDRETADVIAAALYYNDLAKAREEDFAETARSGW